MKSLLAATLLSLAALLAAGSAWAAQLTLQEAIATVQRETHGKVLSAETKHIGKRTIYRIKILTRNGHVRVVEVPAEK